MAHQISAVSFSSSKSLHGMVDRVSADETVETTTTNSSGVSNGTSLLVGSTLYLVCLSKKFLIFLLLTQLKFLMSFVVHITFNCHNTRVAERYMNLTKFASRLRSVEALHSHELN